MSEVKKTAKTESIARGLICRTCGCGHFRVLYTRPTTGGRLMRRRVCRHCGRRVTTYEHIAGSNA